MDKGKKILTIINILLIIIVALLAYLFIFYKKAECPTTENNENVSVTCIKNIQSDSALSTDIHEIITYNKDGAIINDETTSIYTISDDSVYASMKNNLSECTDTYSKDKKIICNIPLSDEKKTIIGTWEYPYINNLKSDGFTCE